MTCFPVVGILSNDTVSPEPILLIRKSKCPPMRCSKINVVRFMHVAKQTNKQIALQLQL